MPKPRILLTRRWPKEAEAKLFEAFDVTADSKDRPISRETLIDALRSHDGLACTVSDQIDAAVIRKSVPCRCKIIANFGVGTNHIDIKVAQESGIIVTNTPDVLTDATADLALTLILMVSRRVGEGEREIRNGLWTGWRPTHMLGRQISGKTLGIVGMGRIGRATAMRAAYGFGMKIIFYNRSALSDCGPIEAKQLSSVEEVCASSDVISLHCASNRDTRHIINQKAISQMKPEAIIINTARGDVIDEEALAEALEQRLIGGAGLDVFQSEPNISPRLINAPNTVLLPHLGSATTETRNAMGMRVLRNLESFFFGRNVLDSVT